MRITARKSRYGVATLPSSWVRPQLQLGKRTLPMFQVCGYAGLLLAFVQSSALVSRLGLSELTLLGITGVVILTFLALTMATKILAGKEIIIYYHHEIALVATTALFLRMTGQPVLPYLDVTALGIGLFLSCGRFGCLMVGCCHGRPCSWGVTYGDEHEQAGFPAYLVEVRLFPIQAVESVFALCLVAAGITATIKGYPPGTGFALYVLLYAAGRFCFEFARGDAVRPYLWGFSEAQWTSSAVTMGQAWAEHAHLIPPYGWHVAIPFLLLAAILTVRLRRRWEQTPRFDLLHPRHVRELAEAVQLAEGTLDPSLLSTSLHFASGSNVIHVANTSLGFRISAGDLNHGSHWIRHYSLSHTAVPLTATSARLLANTLSRLHHASCSFELVPGKSGFFHVIFASVPKEEPFSESGASLERLLGFSRRADPTRQRQELPK